MTYDTQLIAYITVISILTVTPGADTMLVIRSVLGRGQRAGFYATLGISSGLFFHASLSGLGLSILIVQSAAVFGIIKFLGAGYLVVLGFQSLYKIFRSRSAPHDIPSFDTANGTSSIRKMPAYIEGLLTNVLNPKVAIFYLAFLPQFIRPGDHVFVKTMALTAIHVILGLIWLSLVVFLLARLGNLLRQPNLRRILEGISGAILIALGVKLAFEQH